MSSTNQSDKSVHIKMFTSDYCPFCMRAERLLRERGVQQIEKIHVDGNPQIKADMIALTGQRTVPQIYIGDTYVGGCDDLYALDRAGGLDPLLKG